MWWKLLIQKARQQDTLTSCVWGLSDKNTNSLWLGSIKALTHNQTQDIIIKSLHPLGCEIVKCHIFNVNTEGANCTSCWCHRSIWESWDRQDDFQWYFNSAAISWGESCSEKVPHSGSSSTVLVPPTHLPFVSTSAHLSLAPHLLTVPFYLSIHKSRRH